MAINNYNEKERKEQKEAMHTCIDRHFFFIRVYYLKKGEGERQSIGNKSTCYILQIQTNLFGSN
jgi:hypothetical protein